MSLPPPLPHLDKLRGLKAYLSANIIGQQEIIEPVANIILNGELGLAGAERPKGSFLFLGPTGVGKTELTRLFTNYLHESRRDDKLIRLDMSEFKSTDSLDILLGGNLGERGVLGPHFDRTGGTGTILFDEIEKADLRVLDILLQILDAARISLASGETLDLSGYYVAMTSNIASKVLAKVQHSSHVAMTKFVLTQAQAQLRPEILARVDLPCVFAPLKMDEQITIGKLMIERELQRLAGLGHHLETEESVYQFVVSEGYHPSLGARPMRAAVERLLRGAVRERLLAGQPANGKVTVDNQCLIIVD